jgi:class 3 adenylate cyclase
MSETRKIAAILCSDVVGYSRLAGADEDRILARLRALRSDAGSKSTTGARRPAQGGRAEGVSGG